MFLARLPCVKKWVVNSENIGQSFLRDDPPPAGMNAALGANAAPGANAAQGANACFLVDLDVRGENSVNNSTKKFKRFSEKHILNGRRGNVVDIFGEAGVFVDPPPPADGHNWVLPSLVYSFCNLNTFTKFSFLANMLSILWIVIKALVVFSDVFTWTWVVIVSWVSLILQIFVEVGFEQEFYGILFYVFHWNVQFTPPAPLNWGWWWCPLAVVANFYHLVCACCTYAGKSLWAAFFSVNSDATRDISFCWDNKLIVLLYICLSCVAFYYNIGEHETQFNFKFQVGAYCLCCLTWLCLSFSVCVHLEHNLRMTKLLNELFGPIVTLAEKRIVYGTDNHIRFNVTTAVNAGNVKEIIVANLDKLVMLKLFLKIKLVYIILFSASTILTSSLFVFAIEQNSKTAIILYLNGSSLMLQLASAYLIVQYNHIVTKLNDVLEFDSNLAAAIPVVGVVPDMKLLQLVVINIAYQATALGVSSSDSKLCR
jgi:hypothetical protein